MNKGFWRMLLITMIAGIACWALLFLGMQKAFAQDYYGADFRYFYLNDDSCGSGYRENNLRPSIKMWDFYSSPRLYEVETPVNAIGEVKDHKDTVSCVSVKRMNELYGNKAGIALTWGLKRITESDIVIREDYAHNDNSGKCAVLHEMGHTLGLAISPDGSDPISVMSMEWLHGHPVDSQAAMYHQVRCYQNFLTVTDLLLIAETYDAPANCTPYIQKDYSVYFPNIKGFEAELTYDARYNEWNIEWFNPSKPGNWECDLKTTKNSIQGSFYQDGEVYQKTLYFKNGRFTE